MNRAQASALRRDAEIDRNIAAIKAQRAHPPDDAFAVLDRRLAGELAEALAAVAGDAAPAAGRVLVAAAAALKQMVHDMDASGTDPRQAARLMVNLTALAGERMVHGDHG